MHFMLFVSILAAGLPLSMAALFRPTLASGLLFIEPVAQAIRLANPKCLA
jgi:hypothetical protein